jgi:aspartate/methionine/tyrosine aminotransferase
MMVPGFCAYFESCAALGINITGVPMTPHTQTEGPISSGDWKLDPDVLRKHLTNDTKMLILNTPQAPLGKMFTVEELESIATVVKEFPNLMVLSDEVYEYIKFDGHQHNRIANVDGMFERTVSLFSAGKTFSCTGWRLGYAIAPANLVKPMVDMHCTVNFSTTTPLQKATALAMDKAVETDYFTFVS